MTDQRVRNEQSMVMAINHLTRSYRRVVNRALAVHGLSDAQTLPVIFISRLGDGVRQGVLAEQLGIEGPSLVRQLDQLQAAGLVERRDDPTDRRAKCLYLTKSGHDFAALTERLLGDLRGKLLSGVSDAEMAVALKVLRHFEQAVEAALDNGVTAVKV